MIALGESDELGDGPMHQPRVVGSATAFGCTVVPTTAHMPCLAKNANSRESMQDFGFATRHINAIQRSPPILFQ